MNRQFIVAGAVAVAMIAHAYVSGPAGAGRTVDADARSSAPTSTARHAPAVAEAAAVTPLAAVTGVSPLIPVTAVEYDGSQRAMPYELYSAIVSNFPASEVPNAIAITSCETGKTFRADLVSSEGARGVFQVMAVHGEVPADVAGQVAQAARIQRANGWTPWECR